MIFEYQGKLFELRAKNIIASVTLPLKNKKLDGNTSSTLTTTEGSKAKILSVACQLPFEQGQHLTDLIKLAEAVEEDSRRRVYRIQHDEAKVADIREVIFDGNLSYRKTEGLLAWSVNFSLLQYNSVAEAKEARQKELKSKQTTQADSTAGTTIAQAVNNNSKEEVAIKKQYNQFEQFLKKVDQLLAPDSTDETDPARPA